MKAKKHEGESASEGKGAAKGKTPPLSAQLDAAQPSFEESFAVVEETVELLERGNLSLEASVLEYERGLSALKECYAVLERAQKRIEVLGEDVGAVAEGATGLYWKSASSHPALGDAIEPSAPFEPGDEREE